MQLCSVQFPLVKATALSDTLHVVLLQQRSSVASLQ